MKIQKKEKMTLPLRKKIVLFSLKKQLDNKHILKCVCVCVYIGDTLCVCVCVYTYILIYVGQLKFFFFQFSHLKDKVILKRAGNVRT